MSPPEADARERGAQLLDLGRPDEALIHLAQALATDPEDARALCLMGLAKLEAGDPAGAAEAARRAVTAAPEEEWPHRVLALAALQRGKRREAREAAKRAVGLDPEEPLTYLVLSAALAGKDEAGSLAAAEHAIELAPESADAHAALGEVLLRHERDREAAEAFREALALDPEDATAENNLAVANARIGDPEAADAGFERATRLDPTMSVSRENVLLRQGRTARVLRRFAVAAGIVGLLFALAGAWAGLVICGGIAGAFELARWRNLQSLSEANRLLITDDARARRWRVDRWDWKWPLSLRPWWWILLTRLPPPVAAAGNAGLLALAIAAQARFWMIVLAIGLPFSLLRTWRWWRLGHPGAGSWRPPGA